MEIRLELYLLSLMESSLVQINVIMNYQNATFLLSLPIFFDVSSFLKPLNTSIVLA